MPEPTTAAADYEDYSRTSESYDETRVPVGIEILAGCFSCGPRPLAEQVILDGGCGTGSYIAALAGRVGGLHGLELNPGMLARARRKLAGDPGVRLARGSLLDLPYGCRTFDGVMCNQVAHHLGDGPPDFPALRRLLAEARRVLFPGGVLVLHTSSAEQLRDGFWWADLVPEAIERIVERYAPLERVDELLAEAGLDPIDRIVPFRQTLQAPVAYRDPHGPLRAAYRRGDSVWSLATPGELDRGLARLRRMIDGGEVGEYLEARDKLRRRVGQVTFVFARKPGLRPAGQVNLPGGRSQPRRGGSV